MSPGTLGAGVPKGEYVAAALALTPEPTVPLPPLEHQHSANHSHHLRMWITRIMLSQYYTTVCILSSAYVGPVGPTGEGVPEARGVQNG